MTNEETDLPCRSGGAFSLCGKRQLSWAPRPRRVSRATGLYLPRHVGRGRRSRVPRLHTRACARFTLSRRNLIASLTRNPFRYIISIKR